VLVIFAVIREIVLDEDAHFGHRKVFFLRVNQNYLIMQIKRQIIQKLREDYEIGQTNKYVSMTQAMTLLQNFGLPTSKLHLHLNCEFNNKKADAYVYVVFARGVPYETFTVTPRTDYEHLLSSHEVFLRPSYHGLNERMHCLAARGRVHELVDLTVDRAVVTVDFDRYRHGSGTAGGQDKVDTCEESQQNVILSLAVMFRNKGMCAIKYTCSFFICKSS